MELNEICKKFFFSVSSKQTNYYGNCLIEEGETTTTTKTREKKLKIEF